jgi:hypothetical protein
VADYPKPSDPQSWPELELPQSDVTEWPSRICATSIGEAAWMFERIHPDVAGGFICVDVPRAELCFTLDQASRFFQKLPPPPHADGVSSWVPTVDRVELALLGKTLEETCELGKIAARCIMQGLDDRDPETTVANRMALTAELSDMEARILDVRQVLELPMLIENTVRKSKFHLSWLRDLARRFGSRWRP